MDVPQCYLVVTFLLSLQYTDAGGSCLENIYLEVGKQGLVSCHFENFDIIGWINGDGDVTETPPFIFMEGSKKYGQGYRSGDYDMHPNGSLIINEVKLENEFNYTVVFVPHPTGANNYFEVAVKVYGGSCQENIYWEVGKQGVVSCHFVNCDIIGWIHGSGDVTDTSPFIYKEGSQIYGRGYESGDYDMHPNGSLIINEVKLENEFNYTVLFVPSGGANEYFEVPVKVYGGSCQENIYLEVGKQGVVSCHFEKFDIIGWINGSGDVTNTSPFIYMEGSQIYGRGYESGDYDMHPNGSLIINEVKLTNEFNYTVLFVFHPAGSNKYFKVPVKVYVPFDPGFPVVNGRTNQVIVQGNTRGFINCSLTGVRLRVHLEWVASPNEISLESSHRVTDNSDGTYNTYLTSSYKVVNSPTWRVSFKCRVAGQLADLFPLVTTVYLLLEQRFPVVYGLANQQHVVLDVNREGELTCSLDKVSQDVSLELVTISTDSSDEIVLDNKYHITANGDDTVNITLTSSFQVLSDSTQHFTLKCRVSGQAADKYPEATTVELLVTESFPAVNGLANQQHVVLDVNREDELTCSMDKVSQDVSLELVTVFPDSSNEILLDNKYHITANGDDTVNITLTSSFRVLSDSTQHFTLQCRVSGQAADKYPEATTVELLVTETTSMLPVPVIDGCYSQPEACTLMMTTEETITCSVKGVPHHFDLNLDLYTLPDLRCLSLITDRIDTHRSGYYDIITNCRYIVDETFIDTTVHCFLSGTDRNIQPVNSTVKAKVMWQATDQEYESVLSREPTLAIVLILSLVNITIFWLIFVSWMKRHKDFARKYHWVIANPGQQTDLKEADTEEIQPLQPLNNKDKIEAQCSQCSHFREMQTKLLNLLKDHESISDSGMSSCPSSSTASGDPRDLL